MNKKLKENAEKEITKVKDDAEKENTKVMDHSGLTHLLHFVCHNDRIQVKIHSYAIKMNN